MCIFKYSKIGSSIADAFRMAWHMKSSVTLIQNLNKLIKPFVVYFNEKKFTMIIDQLACG
jgi:hypothetical protein